ncbi:EcsC family protein [Psychrobacter frigidicola]|uniref:EcsC family protein n=1 Tax=Psychrobacter frigidicola TaxID=45611 RepID=A0A5C7A5I9_9GAMM|nr:EcsC family protein [Psychrobacter frigidicola]TXD97814.1 EcsC family protein [Psychrobacter frigidicola]
MAKVISPEKMQGLLDWTYDKAVQGIPGMGSAIDLAEDYMTGPGTTEDKVNSLIRWQNTKAGSAGFIAGLGGLITLPVALPVNIASLIYVHIRMVAAIAHMTGHDLKNDKVKALIYLCLLGSSMDEVAKDSGITFGTNFTTSYIEKNVTGVALTKIKRAVSFRLVTKFSTRGLINLGGVVPVLGGVICGGFDIFTTNIVGNQARKAFLVFEPTDYKVDLSSFKDVSSSTLNTP